jgi:DNA polymerase elongation subunit (family B)
MDLQTEHFGSANAGFDLFDDPRESDPRSTGVVDATDFIVDIREYDVPYHVRVAIDKGTLHERRIRLYQILIDCRYSNWEMVHSRGKAWSYDL